MKTKLEKEMANQTQLKDTITDLNAQIENLKAQVKTVKPQKHKFILDILSGKISVLEKITVNDVHIVYNYIVCIAKYTYIIGNSLVLCHYVITKCYFLYRISIWLLQEATLQTILYWWWEGYSKKLWILYLEYILLFPVNKFILMNRSAIQF